MNAFISRRILFLAELPGSWDQIQAKGGVHSLKFLYDGTAWDVESGISVTDRHYKSRQGAIEHAVQKLVSVLKAKGLVS